MRILTGLYPIKMQDNFSMAIKDFSKAIDLNPLDEEAFYNRGIVHYIMKDYDKAIKDYNEVIELNNEYENAYNGRGVAFYYQGQYEKAIKDYMKVIKLNPYNNEVYYNLALICKLKECESTIKAECKKCGGKLCFNI